MRRGEAEGNAEEVGGDAGVAEDMEEEEKRKDGSYDDTAQGHERLVSPEVARRSGGGVMSARKARATRPGPAASSSLPVDLLPRLLDSHGGA